MYTLPETNSLKAPENGLVGVRILGFLLGRSKKTAYFQGGHLALTY